MIKRRVRLKITASSRQTVVAAGQRLSALCPLCGREVEMLTGAQAAAVLEVDGRALESLVDGGLVHAVRTVSGSLWVCKESLFDTGGSL